MKIYCMSDIHGNISAFEEALLLVEEHLDEPDTMLCLLGDYIHGYRGMTGSYDVLDKIISLQNKYGSDKVVALLGNHEEMVLDGISSIDDIELSYDDYEEYDEKDDAYICWMSNLPRYYTEGNTIFCHAGIDEEYGEMWEWETSDITYTQKYPAETGQIAGLDMKVVAGHVYTAEISGDPGYHEIYYDGASHYYIDGEVNVSWELPILLVVTGNEEDKYYSVTESGPFLVLPYEEDEY